MFDIFRKFGKEHREGGPARTVYYSDGMVYFKEYSINGMMHREDGPAVTVYFLSGSIRYIYYCFNDLFHREDGPAQITCDWNGAILMEEYYLHGNKTDKSFMK
jgi:hypothetical protein